jgi:hypothetical protein
MINFKEEIQKYKPVLEVEQVEDSVYSDEIEDLLEILQYMNKKIKKSDDYR